MAGDSFVWWQMPPFFRTSMILITMEAIFVSDPSDPPVPGCIQTGDMDGNKVVCISMFFCRILNMSPSMVFHSLGGPTAWEKAMVSTMPANGQSANGGNWRQRACVCLV